MSQSNEKNAIAKAAPWALTFVFGAVVGFMGHMGLTGDFSNAKRGSGKAAVSAQTNLIPVTHVSLGRDPGGYWTVVFKTPQGDKVFGVNCKEDVALIAQEGGFQKFASKHGYELQAPAKPSANDVKPILVGGCTNDLGF